MPADTSCITIEGPWTHRYVTANGAQFHLAHMGEYVPDRPLVVLVHGFPEYWWAWRHQLPAIAAAGYEVVAVDLRGVGGSDKTPDLVDGLTLSEDLTALVRALGYDKAVLVGHGRGGDYAWTATSMEPDLIAGLATISAPHPRTVQRIGTHVTLRTWRHAARLITPGFGKRILAKDGTVESLLAEFSAPGNTGASGEADAYESALRVPGAAPLAVDSLRWTWVSTGTSSRRAYFKASTNPVNIPVVAIRGQLDPLLPPRAWDRDREFAHGSYRRIQVANAGHFPHEEQPGAVTDILLGFIASLS